MKSPRSLFFTPCLKVSEAPAYEGCMIVSTSTLRKRTPGYDDKLPKVPYLVLHNPGKATKLSRAAEIPWLSYWKMSINEGARGL